MSRGDEPQAFGWAGRAGRVLEGIPQNPGHGYLLYLSEVQVNLHTGDPSAAVEAAHQVHGLGREFNDPDLLAAGLYGQGHALIKLGQVTDGLALLDEAMVGVLDGQVASPMAGALYCNTIAACHEVFDLRRMARWTESAVGVPLRRRRRRARDAFLRTNPIHPPAPEVTQPRLGRTAMIHKRDSYALIPE